MANKIGFYGTDCYDLINYLSRILYHLNAGPILMLDLSENQSLSHSIPNVGIDRSTIIDYRGVSFSNTFHEDMLYDYEIILIYFGFNQNSIPVNQAYLVSSCELHIIDQIHTLIHSNTIKSKNGATLDLIVLGAGASQREKFVTMQLGIPLDHSIAVDLDDVNMECRLFCQYDTIYKFSRISSIYKELLQKICFKALGNSITIKDYKKARRLAEGGK